jgi:hypothetical protein
MVRKLFPALIGVSVVAAACGPPDIVAETVGPEDVDFVRQVVDVDGDVGLGLSMTSDAEGNPHMSYLAFERELEPGEVAPPADVFAPTLPAVKEAHLIGGVWTRSVAADDLREQPEEEPDPDAPPPEPGPPLIEPEDETALALDEPGAHQVAWTQGDTIQYVAEDAEEPQTVFEGRAAGLSMTVDGDGAPWLAFYELQPGPEGPGALVRVATLDGERWMVETAAEADVTGPPRTGIGVVGNEVLVAYSSGGTVSVARSGETWESEDVADGVGVSLDVDGDGNPHLAFYTNQNVRHAHSIGGSPWDVTPVGDAGARPEDDWSTAIAVAEDGTHHVTWQTADAIGYANNAENQFQEEDVPGAEGAWGPRAAAGPDGDLYLAWYDTEEQVLTMAVRSDQAPLLAAPHPDPAAEQPPGAPVDQEGPPPCGPNGTEVTIAAPPGAAASGFDTECLAVSPDEPFTIEFIEEDPGIPHNVAIYTDATAEEALFVGDVVNDETIVYEVDPLDEGRYFFRCDLHPTTMTGTFVVE